MRIWFLGGALALSLGFALTACGGGNSESNDASSSSSAQTTSTQASEAASTATTAPAPSPTLPPVGDSRLRIPAIGIDAAITPKSVPPEGYLPNPDNPDDPVLYDFTALDGYGGQPGTGNAIMFGAPDSGSKPCKGGTEPPPCKAVFWDLGLLKSGDQVVIDWEGQRYTYSVVSLCEIAKDDPAVDQIYHSTDTPSLTLTSAGGKFDFDTSSYPNVVFVRAEAESGTLPPSCPSPSTALPRPTPGPSPTPKPKADVTITSLPESVGIGSQLHVEVMSTAGANCAFRIYSADGTPEMGATQDVEDASGSLVVDLRVRDTVTPGNKRFEVDCGTEPDSRDLVVTQ